MYCKANIDPWLCALEITKCSKTFMASLKLVTLYVLVSFLTNFATIEAQDFGRVDPICPGKKAAPNSTFQSNLKTLLTYLSSNATANREFNSATIAGTSISDTVYGLYVCRGDVPPQLCGQCILNATQVLNLNCYLSNEAIVWGDTCMLRYSNRYFFSAVDTSTTLWYESTASISDSIRANFSSSLLVTMNRTADQAANNPTGAQKYYATEEAKISGFQTLYCLVQCTQDLSPRDCSKCLRALIDQLSTTCEGKLGCTFHSSSCSVRFELYPFYRPNHSISTPPLSPSTNTAPHISDDPVYNYHYCSSNKKFPTNLYKELIVDILLRSLSFQAARVTDFYSPFSSRNNPDEAAYGLFMCHGDISQPLCQQCVQKATDRISSACHSSKEAIIWYEQCMLRYSNEYFLEAVDRYPRFTSFNITNHNQQSLFTWLLGDTLAKVVQEASDSSYATRSVKVNEFQTLYTLAQCTYDLTGDECRACLEDAMGTAIPWCCLASAGGRVLYPSCNLRFELFPFYRDGDQARAGAKPTPPPLAWPKVCR